MTFPRNSLRAFLHHAKRSLTQAINGCQKLSIVIGNESADLDSLTSSLLYAYVRSISPPQDAFAPLYVPLLNTPSTALRLRPEFSAVCKHANISPSSLITLDDFPLPATSIPNVRWVLVDHNRLQGGLGKSYSSSVNGVIDHHEEENAVPQETGPEPRIIEKCGSCTSLVVDYCKKSWDSISGLSLSSGAGHAQGDSLVDDSTVAQGWDAQIATMALASILIDTANLTAPGKVEDVDRRAVEYLEAKIQMSHQHAKSWSRDAFYKEIDQAKRDIDSLNMGEILQKDYKQWTENGLNLGISSVVKPLGYLVKKIASDSRSPTYDDELMKFMKEHSLCIFAVMTTSTTAEGQFQRELLVQASEEGHPAMMNFTERAGPAFRLEEVELEELSTQQTPQSGNIWRKTWLQKDVSQSRKQVAPFLRESMRGS